jgi:hypothetical protein
MSGLLSRALPVAFLVALALPATGHAGGWTDPVDTGPSGPYTFTRHVGALAAGNASGRFEYAVATGSSSDPSVTVLAHAPNSAGAWSATGALGSIGTNQGEVAFDQNAAGDAVVAWATAASADNVIVRYRRGATGTWSDPLTVNEGLAGRGDFPLVHVGPDGVATIAFQQDTSRVEVRPLALAFGSLGMTSTILTGGSYARPGAFAQAPDGTVSLLAVSAETNGDVYVADSADGGTAWSAGTDVGDTVNLNFTVPGFAYAADGALWVAWTAAGNGTTIDYAVHYRRRPAGGAWSDAAADAHVLGPEDPGSSVQWVWPTVAAAADGTVAIAFVYYSQVAHYTTYYGSANVVAAITWDPDTGFDDLDVISPIGSYARPHAVAAGDDIVVGWYGAVRPEEPASWPASAMWGTVRHAGSWQAAPTRLSAPGANVNQYGTSVSADGRGNAVALWNEGSEYVARAYATGTRLLADDVHVPATGLTTTAIPVSATANANPWAASSTVSYVWKVDGVQVATGASASLSITAPGLHDVSVTVDGTTITRQVGVSTPGAPPDRDFDGVPDASDCAPDDAARPARGVADANCNGEDDAVEVKRAQDEAIRKAIEIARQTALQSFLIGAQHAIKSAPKPTPVNTVLKTGVVSSTFQAAGPSTVVQQLTGLLDASGRVVAAGGGNVVAAGGGNVVAAGGLNLINIGAGVVAAGGGNVVAPGGANLVQRALAPFDRAVKRPRSRQVLLGSVGKRVDRAGKVRLKLKLTPAGRRAVTKYRATARSLRARHRKVAPLKLKFTTIVGPRAYDREQKAAVATVTFTIRG